MAILTLDLGTKMGWAMAYSPTSRFSGTYSFRPMRFEGGGMRFLRFRQWLDSMHKMDNPITSVHFEEVRRHLGVDAAHIYGGFLGVLSQWCEEREIPYEGIPVGTIKKHIAGKGNASKEEVIAAVKAKGFEPADDNEADALALLDLILTRNAGN